MSDDSELEQLLKDFQKALDTLNRIGDVERLITKVDAKKNRKLLKKVKTVVSDVHNKASVIKETFSNVYDKTKIGNKSERDGSSLNKGISNKETELSDNSGDCSSPVIGVKSKHLKKSSAPHRDAEVKETDKETKQTTDPTQCNGHLEEQGQQSPIVGKQKKSCRIMLDRMSIDDGEDKQLEKNDDINNANNNSSMDVTDVVADENEVMDESVEESTANRDSSEEIIEDTPPKPSVLRATVSTRKKYDKTNQDISDDEIIHSSSETEEKDEADKEKNKNNKSTKKQSKSFKKKNGNMENDNNDEQLEEKNQQNKDSDDIDNVRKSRQDKKNKTKKDKSEDSSSEDEARKTNKNNKVQESEKEDSDSDIVEILDEDDTNEENQSEADKQKTTDESDDDAKTGNPKKNNNSETSDKDKESSEENSDDLDINIKKRKNKKETNKNKKDIASEENDEGANKNKNKKTGKDKDQNEDDKNINCEDSDKSSPNETDREKQNEANKTVDTEDSSNKDDAEPTKKGSEKNCDEPDVDVSKEVKEEHISDKPLVPRIKLVDINKLLAPNKKPLDMTPTPGKNTDFTPFDEPVIILTSSDDDIPIKKTKESSSTAKRAVRETRKASKVVDLSDSDFSKDEKSIRNKRNTQKTKKKDNRLSSDRSSDDSDYVGGSRARRLRNCKKPSVGRFDELIKKRSAKKSSSRKQIYTDDSSDEETRKSTRKSKRIKRRSSSSDDSDEDWAEKNRKKNNKKKRKRKKLVEQISLSDDSESSDQEVVRSSVKTTINHPKADKNDPKFSMEVSIRLPKFKCEELAELYKKKNELFEAKAMSKRGRPVRQSSDDSDRPQSKKVKLNNKTEDMKEDNKKNVEEKADEADVSDVEQVEEHRDEPAEKVDNGDHENCNENGEKKSEEQKNSEKTDKQCDDDTEQVIANEVIGKDKDTEAKATEDDEEKEHEKDKNSATEDDNGKEKKDDISSEEKNKSKEKKEKSKKNDSSESDDDSDKQDSNDKKEKSKKISRNSIESDDDSDKRPKKDDINNKEENKPNKKKEKSKKATISTSSEDDNEKREKKDDVSSEEENEPKKKKDKSKKVATSASSGSDNDEEERGKKDESSEEENLKKKNAKDKKDGSSASSDSDDDFTNFSRKSKSKKELAGDSKKKTKKTLISDSDSGGDDNDDLKDDSEKDGSEKNDAESEEFTKPARKRIKRVKDSSSDDEDKSTRKQIRKMIDRDSLSETTKKAEQEEKERKARIAEKQKKYNQIFELKADATVDKVVLDFDEKTDKPLLSVHKKLVKHLKPHQVHGVKFMWDTCFESLERARNTPGSGCILAHCMGLGKTLQVIALVHTLLTNQEKTKVERVLVVCPVSTVLNWKNEFKKWMPKSDEFEIYELVSCKTTSINHERNYVVKSWHEDGGVLIIGYNMFRTLSNPQNKTISKKLRESFHKGLVDPGPDLVVCDEGHLLKNEKSNLSIAMNRIKTARRIVLTGTPLQNNLREYWCMVQFIKPNLLGTYKEYLNRFVNPITNGQYTDSTQHDIMVMRRRSHVLHKLLDGVVQRQDYSVLEPYLPPKYEYVVFVQLTEIQVKLYKHYMNHLARRGENSNKTSALFNDFQRLQMICTHPRVLLEKSIKDRQKEEKIDESESEGSLKDFIDDESSTSASSTSSGSEDGFISDDSGEAKISKGNKKTKSVIRRKTRMTRALAADQRENGVLSNDEEEKEQQKEWWEDYISREELDDIKHSSKIFLLFQILKECEEIGDKILIFSQSLYTLNCIEYFLEKIDEASQKGDTENLGSYSGSWSLGLDYFRLDGSSSCDNRATWCDQFNDPDNTRARLFLISTKAGGLGINLVAANRVIIFDVSWNPSHDIQSIYRVYRFGQNKPAYIYRFVTYGTMEMKIYERQVTKQAISKRVIDEQQIDRHYSQNDIMELYNTDLEPSDRPIPMVPKDVLLGEMLQKHEQTIYKYHEHQSLLENKQDEELNEEERKAAWEEFENEKVMRKTTIANFGAPNNSATNFSPQLIQMALANIVRKDNPTWSEIQIKGIIPALVSQLQVQMSENDFTLYNRVQQEIRLMQALHAQRMREIYMKQYQTQMQQKMAHDMLGNMAIGPEELRRIQMAQASQNFVQGPTTSAVGSGDVIELND